MKILLNKKSFHLIICLSIMVSGCSVDIKDKYDCPCKDIAEEFKNADYDELVKVWGEPKSTSYDDSDRKTSVLWERLGMFTDSDMINMEFSASTYTYTLLEPVGKPTFIRCQGEPYMSAGAGMQRSMDIIWHE